MAERSPWSRFVDSAVQGAGTQAAGPGHAGPAPAATGNRADGTPRLGAGRLGQRVRTAWRGRPKGDTPAAASRRRTDVRLALPALLVWAAAAAGAWLNPAALLALCFGSVLAAGALLIRAIRGRTLKARGRSFLMTVAVALVLAAAAASHSAVLSSQRHDGALADAAASRQSVVAVIEVAGSPRAMAAPGAAGPPERWSVPVRADEVRVNGHVVRAGVRMLVMGGSGWGDLVPGQVLRTAGKLKPAEPGRLEAAVLTASLPPAAGAGGPGNQNAPGWELAAEELRGQYFSAVSFLAPDPRGLLPGMVTGDTAALDEGLNAAMKTVGLTHLTAVSGANCSLVLGALLVLARSLRLPRIPAAGLALAGLGLFVVLVGPDASVLRAALMGSVAIASLAGGRVGRGLSFLCLAVMGLVLIDPGLATSFGFLLSVLATLGIIVLGAGMMEWIPAVVPRWAAASLAVPLSAQLLCGPVIVLLQPQFSTYSLPANIVAAPLVAPVTLLGTAAVPLVIWLPWLATGLIAVAGTFSSGVAAVARTAAGLPGAALPWPEGPFGLLTMVLLSALTLAGVRAAARPRQMIRFVLAVHARTVFLLGFAESRVQNSRKRSPRLPRSGAGYGGRSQEPAAGRSRLSSGIPGRKPPGLPPKAVEPLRRRRRLPPAGL